MIISIVHSNSHIIKRITNILDYHLHHPYTISNTLIPADLYFTDTLIFAAYSILPERSREAAFQPMPHLFRLDPAHFAGARADIGTGPSRFPSPFRNGKRT